MGRQLMKRILRSLTTERLHCELEEFWQSKFRLLQNLEYCDQLSLMISGISDTCENYDTNWFMNVDYEYCHEIWSWKHLHDTLDLCDCSKITCLVLFKEHFQSVWLVQWSEHSIFALHNHYATSRQFCTLVIFFPVYFHYFGQKKGCQFYLFCVRDQSTLSTF